MCVLLPYDKLQLIGDLAAPLDLERGRPIEGKYHANDGSGLHLKLRNTNAARPAVANLKVLLLAFQNRLRDVNKNAIVGRTETMPFVLHGTRQLEGQRDRVLTSRNPDVGDLLVLEVLSQDTNVA